MAQTFDENELFELIRSKLNTGQNETTANSAAISTLQAQVGTLQTQMTSLQGRVSTLEAGGGGSSGGGSSGGGSTPTPTFAFSSRGPTSYAGAVSQAPAGTIVTLTFSNGTATATLNASGAWSLTTTARTGAFSASVTVSGTTTTSAVQTIDSPSTTGGTGTGTPATPTNLQTTSTDDTITLTWTRPNEDNISVYELVLNGSKVAEAPPAASGTTQSYTFTGLSSGTSYLPGVRGSNVNGLDGSTATTSKATTGTSGGGGSIGESGVEDLTVPSYVTPRTVLGQPGKLAVNFGTRYDKPDITGYEVFVNGTYVTTRVQSDGGYVPLSGLSETAPSNVDIRAINSSTLQRSAFIRGTETADGSDPNA